MGLLSKLKSMLGLEESERAPGSGVDVTVEREPDAGDGAAAASAEPTDDDVADGTETAAGEEPLAEDTDEPAETDDDSEYVTTDADVGTEGVDEDAADETDAAADSDEPEGDADADPEPDDLTEIKGVGPAYADRLNDAGVTTFAGLADADPDELAAETDLSPKRVGRWIDRAGDR